MMISRGMKGKATSTYGILGRLSRSNFALFTRGSSHDGTSNLRHRHPLQDTHTHLAQTRQTSILHAPLLKLELLGVVVAA